MSGHTFGLETDRGMRKLFPFLNIAEVSRDVLKGFKLDFATNWVEDVVQS